MGYFYVAVVALAFTGSVAHAKAPCEGVLIEHGLLKAANTGDRAIASADSTREETAAAANFIQVYLGTAGTSKSDVRALAKYLLSAAHEIETSKQVSYSHIVVFLKAAVEYVNAEGSTYKNNGGLRKFFDSCHLPGEGPKDPLEYGSVEIVKQRKK